MGMDIYGCNPISESGKYFRASIDMWRELLLLVETSGVNVPVSWAANGGAGVPTADEARTIASKVRAYMNGEVEPCQNNHEASAALERNIAMFDEQLAGELPEGFAVHRPGPHGLPSWKVDEFLEFLDTCGGFQIW